MSDLDDKLPDDVRQLLLRAAPPDGPAPGQADRIWQRALHSAALPLGPATPVAKAAGLGVGKGLVLITATVLAGVALVSRLAAKEEAPPAPQAAEARSGPEPTREVPSPVEPAPETSPSPPPPPAPLRRAGGEKAPSAAAPAPSVSNRTEPESSFHQERALVDAARQALRDRRHLEALAEVERHQVRFPQGRLAEEREAIAIRAYAGLERWAEVRSRIARFRQSFPGSVFLPLIDATEAEAP